MKRGWWRTYWPHVFGSIVALIVGLPAGVASYRHGITVVEQHSTDPEMAPWLPMTTDGLLLAALVVMWARRLTGRKVGVGPWAAFLLGLGATLLTNLGAAKLDPWGIGVALWPPACLAIVLELVALVVTPDRAEPVPVTETVTAPAAATMTETVTAVAPVPVPAIETVTETDAETVTVTASVTETVPDEPVTVTDAETVTVTAETASDQAGHAAGAGTVTDEEILAWLRGRAAEDRMVPSRKAVIKEWSIGATRADRLRGLVTVPARIRRVK